MDASTKAEYLASMPTMRYESIPLQNMDTDSQPPPLSSVHVERGLTPSRKYLSLRLLSPTIAVFLGTAGLATTLIIWILTHKTQSSLAEVYKDGAFLLDEGTDTEAGLEAGRLIGLTISSAASTAIGLFTPVFMGLYAYRTASVWAEAQANDLPTPLQYGLLLDALTGTGVVSLVNTWLYFLASKRNRKLSPMLVEAFVVALLAYLLVHTVSAVDLWLHAVTSSVVVATDVPTPPSDYGFSSICPPYGGGHDNCQWSAGGWQGDRVPGMLTLSNNSQLYRSITLYDADDMASLVNPSVPQKVAFQAQSFGVQASCESLNAQCGLPYPTNNLTCPGFPSDIFPPTNSSVIATQPGIQVPVAQSGAYFLTGFCPTCEHLGTNGINIGTAKSRQNETRPYSMWIQMVWDGSSQYLYRELASKNNTAVSATGDGAMLIANCSLSIYNVTLAYRNGSYSLLDKELTNSGQADAMFVPTRFGFFSSNLVSSIEGVAFQANTTEDVVAILEQNLARLALAAAAPVTQPGELTLSQSLLVSRILGRYPFWPVVVTLTLLFLYAAFALAVCVATALASADVIHVPGNPRPVLSLDLAVLRLTNHVALAAELFPEGIHDRRLVLSMQTDAMKMHNEEGEQGTGVRIGLHKDKDSGGLMFGLHKECSDDDRVFDQKD